MALPLLLGREIEGAPLVADLAALPHLLVVGGSDADRRSCLHAILLSLLYARRSNELKLVLCGPDNDEFAPFARLPHLLAPAISGVAKTLAICEWAVKTMDSRYDLLASAQVRDVSGYNLLSPEERLGRFEPMSEKDWAQVPTHLPRLAIVVNELAEVMAVHHETAEPMLSRLAQLGRAVGIHLVLMTWQYRLLAQCPLLTMEIPSRIAFRLPGREASRTVLGREGAERLLAQREMLCVLKHVGAAIHGLGVLVDEQEIRRTTDFLCAYAPARYDPVLARIAKGGPA